MRWVACWLAMTTLTMCGMYVPVILMLPFLGPSPLLVAKMDVAFHLFRRWPMRAWKFYIGGAHSNQRSSNCRHLLVLECIVSCFRPVYTSMELFWALLLASGVCSRGLWTCTELLLWSPCIFAALKIMLCMLANHFHMCRSLTFLYNAYYLLLNLQRKSGSIPISRVWSRRRICVWVELHRQRYVLHCFFLSSYCSM